MTNNISDKHSDNRKTLNKRVLNPIIKNIGAINSANPVRKRDEVEPIPIGSENL